MFFFSPCVVSPSVNKTVEHIRSQSAAFDWDYAVSFVCLVAVFVVVCLWNVIKAQTPTLELNTTPA